MPNEITTQQLKQLKSAKDVLVVLDVRGPRAYQQHHIPGAKSAPLDDEDAFDGVLRQEAPDKHEAVVVYAEDRQDPRGHRAAQHLEDRGYIEVYHLTGGLQSWADLPTSMDSGGRAPATEAHDAGVPDQPPRRY